MDPEQQKALEEVSTYFLAKNYDRLWLKTMLAKARANTMEGATLITGSSHALNGIWEGAWNHAVNCSMHSQDLYYDFMCAKHVLTAASGKRKHGYRRCFIVMGYYIAFQDLSRSTIMRESMISNIYYPVLGDAHNWKTPVANDPWAGIDDLPDQIKSICEQLAADQILNYGTYYSPLRKRSSYFDLQGRTWGQLSDAERRYLGQLRADDHNKAIRYEKSFEENKRIFREFVHLLYSEDVLPVVVITPFTEAYDRCVLPEMKSAVLELLDSVPEEVHYVDFNESAMFTHDDFMDTDHLNGVGARKVSSILAELFGR